MLLHMLQWWKRSSWDHPCKFCYMPSRTAKCRSWFIYFLRGIQRKWPLKRSRICLQRKKGLAFENSIRPHLQKTDTGSVFCQNQFCKRARVQIGLWQRKTEICQNLILVNKKWVINFNWGQNPLFEMAVDKSREIFKGQDYSYWIPHKK